MRSIDISTEIRVAVLGDWAPPQLANVLAIQRAEAPEALPVLIDAAAIGQRQERPGDGFDFALSATPGGQFWAAFNKSRLFSGKNAAFYFLIFDSSGGED